MDCTSENWMNHFISRNKLASKYKPLDHVHLLQTSPFRGWSKYLMAWALQCYVFKSSSRWYLFSMLNTIRIGRRWINSRLFSIIQWARNLVFTCRCIFARKMDYFLNQLFILHFCTYHTLIRSPKRLDIYDNFSRSFMTLYRSY